MAIKAQALCSNHKIDVDISIVLAEALSSLAKTLQTDFNHHAAHLPGCTV